ncbi:CHASE domain-containing protein [Paucibacter sp. AS339]|uniref:CHASE domain-containing protein n=1 Tax=Paucibacter hankyongi TaxID=3133434 RepID=UPI00309E39A0
MRSVLGEQWRVHLRWAIRICAELALLLALCAALNRYWLHPRLSSLGWELHIWAELLLWMLPAVTLLAWRGSTFARNSLGAGPKGRLAAPLRRARIVLLLGLLLNGLLLHYQIASIYSLSQVRFDRLAAGLEDDLRRRFEHPSHGLRALAAHYAASLSLRRDEFANFVQANRPPIEFSAINSYGFIEKVPREELDNFVHLQRGSGAPGFEVKGDTPGDTLYIVKYIEPLAQNRALLGQDLSAEPVRRAAVELAFRSGQPTLSGPITLDNKGETATGFLYLLPLQFSGANTSTEAQRIEGTAGLLFAPIVLDNLMEGIGAGIQGLLDFELFDGPPGKAQGLVFELYKGLGPGGRTKVKSEQDLHQRMFYSDRSLFIGGRELGLRLSTTTMFATLAAESRPIWIGLGGAAMSLLAAAIVYLLSIGRARAETLADEMTVDLRRATATAEAALRDHGFMLDTLNQHSLVSMADAQGRLIYANDEFCRVTGYPREDLLGRDHRVVTPLPESEPELKKGSAMLAQGQIWSSVVGYSNRQGEPFWVKLTVAPCLDEQGKVERYVAIQTDISTQKQLEDSLAQGNERFALALEGGSDGLWDRVDTHGEAEWWSPQYFRMLGLEPGEITPSVSEFDSRLHPDDLAHTLAALADALQDIAPYDVEFRLFIRGCGYRWFRSRAKVFFDAEGHHRRMAGSLQDVHELKMAEARMKERSDQLAAVFALSPDGFVSIGAEHTVRYVSPAFTQFTGMSADSVFELEPVRLLERLCAQSHSVADDPTDTQAEVITLHALKQGPRKLEIQTPMHRMLELSLHEGGSGEVTQVLLLRDVTHQHEVDRLKSEFLTTAAHELRTPMASIYGFTELLMTRQMAPERQQQMLERIYRQSEAMIAIINELLDLARIEDRRGQDFELADQVLQPLVEQCLQDFRIPEDRTPPEFDPSTAPLTVHVDALKIQQVLRNLISNAYKFSAPGTSVWVRVSSTPTDPPQARIDVQDQGRGMTAEQLARVTERFYRADQSGNVLGVGLGMSIVKEIVDLHGGQLLMSSEPGQGSTFSVLLPLSVSSSADSSSNALDGESPVV